MQRLGRYIVKILLDIHNSIHNHSNVKGELILNLQKSFLIQYIITKLSHIYCFFEFIQSRAKNYICLQLLYLTFVCVCMKEGNLGICFKTRQDLLLSMS